MNRPFYDQVSRRPRIFNLLHKLHLITPQTQTHPAERAVLRKHIRECVSAVEVGTYMGVTAAELASELPQGGMLYCVDPYLNDDPYMRVAQRHFDRQKVTSKIQILAATSTQAASVLPVEIDFFFIDGDHSRKGLEADWKVVQQLLKINGVAAFHDTSPIHDEHRNSVEAIGFFDEVIKTDKRFKLVETCMSTNILVRLA
jgi:predicted O-methyltransferase YrrM